MQTIRTRTRVVEMPLWLSLLLVFAFAACSGSEGGSDSTENPTATEIPPSQAVDLARTAMTELESFSFQLVHDSGHTTLSGALELTRAGGLVATNGLDLEAEANIGRAFVRVEAIVIDQQTWMTNPLTGVWSEIPPEESPFSFLDPVQLVANILGDTMNAEHSAESASNDEYQIAGTIPAPSLATLVGSVDPTASPHVILDINRTNNLLERVEIRGIVQPEDEPDTVRVITLSEFDKSVELEPPI